MEPAVPDDFELRRRAREMANDWAVAVIICVTATTMLLSETVTQLCGRAGFVYPQEGFLVPPEVRFMTAVILVFHLALLAYLAWRPRYEPRRKYVLVVLRAVLLGFLGWAEWFNTQPVFGLLIPSLTFMMLIVLTGMSFSRGAVILAGVLSCVVYAIVSLLGPTGPISVRASVSVVHGLIVASCVTAYVVHGMLRMHAEAVSSERLSRFFAPEVAARIATEHDVAVRADERRVTVLFCDISGFTERSSTMTPQQVVDLLNAYFPPLVEIVFRYEGTLEKFIGDALVAIWGAPFTHADDADRAVAAAIDMQDGIGPLNARLVAAGQQPIQVHIGLCSGPAAAGYIGTERYIQYAVIGDTTNVASRVCSAAGPGEILLTESTRALVRRGDVRFEPLPPVSVKGKGEPLVLHRVLPPQGSTA